jgi:hypothetical protein
MPATVAELEREVERLQKENSELRLKILKGVLKVCSHCKSVQSGAGQWLPLDRFIELHTMATCSHGYCEDCASRLLEEAMAEESRAL